MKIFFLASFISCFSLLFSPLATAQKITVNADDYQQEFEGAGVTIADYVAFHYSMPEAGQAEALDFLMTKLNMRYLQDYPIFRVTDRPDYYQLRADYFLQSRALNPDIEISIVGQRLPDNLRNDTTINGQTVKRLDWRRPTIYKDLAEWYFEILHFYAERGIPVEIFNPINEPDFNKNWFYGFGQDNKRGTALIYIETVRELRALIENPSINTAGVIQPKIMGPSTIGPGGCRDFIRYYKENFPEAWDNIDIVGFHQYTGGTSSNLNFLVRESEGRPLHQNEMHTNRGDGLPELLNLSKNHRGVISLARTFGAAVNRGANAWYYFYANFPDAESNPGLIRVPFNTQRPVPFPHYYSYRQLTSAQPENSRVVTRTLGSIRADGEVVCFRPEGSDSVYVHYANFTSATRNTVLEIRRENGDLYPIRGYYQRTTDETKRDSITAFTTVDSISTTVVAGPYSVNTYVVAIDGVSSVSEPSVNAFSVWQSAKTLHYAIEGQNLKQVQIIDFAGRLLHQSEISQEPTVQLDRLKTGMYTIKVKSDTQEWTKAFYWK